MRQLMADCVEARLTVAATQDVELRMSWSGSSPAVWGDRLRLAQAVGNVIANAIEHGGGVVSVHGRGGPGRVRIEVIDEGPGLPAPVSELARRPHAGRGLRGRGLAIATAIITRHGGRLAAAPCARGARVVIELPATRAGGPPAPRIRDGAPARTVHFRLSRAPLLVHRPRVAGSPDEDTDQNFMRTERQDHAVPLAPRVFFSLHLKGP